MNKYLFSKTKAGYLLRDKLLESNKRVQKSVSRLIHKHLTLVKELEDKKISNHLKIQYYHHLLRSCYFDFEDDLEINDLARNIILSKMREGIRFQ